jgi:hypothetical protein
MTFEDELREEEIVKNAMDFLIGLLVPVVIQWKFA